MRMLALHNDLMPPSRKPRKAYRPSPVNPLAHIAAMTGAGLLTLDDRAAWALQLDAAIMEVGKGTASKEHWDTILGALALSEELVRVHRYQDEGGIIPAAQQACVDILRRRKGGKSAVYASELVSLRLLMSIWIDLLEKTTMSQKFDAEARIRQRRSSPNTIKVPKP